MDSMKTVKSERQNTHTMYNSAEGIVTKITNDI